MRPNYASQAGLPLMQVIFSSGEAAGLGFGVDAVEQSERPVAGPGRAPDLILALLAELARQLGILGLEVARPLQRFLEFGILAAEAAGGEGDRLAKSTSSKAMALRTATKGKRFQELDRRVRQELAAIDGAIILSRQGEIHSVGAILKISAAGAGGGRLAAAQALSGVGLGIKVSQDGGITGFRGSPPRVAFRVM